MYIGGVYQREIEVGDASIVGKLARGLYGEAMAGVRDMQKEIASICADETKDAKQADSKEG